MSNLISSALHDGGLNQWSVNNAIHICSGDPADRAAVITNSLGSYALTGGDFTIANGTVSGRRVDVAAQSGSTATASGSAAVMCLIDATTLHYKRDLSNPQSVTSGNPLDIATFGYEIRDPA